MKKNGRETKKNCFLKKYYLWVIEINYVWDVKILTPLIQTLVAIVAWWENSLFREIKRKRRELNGFDLIYRCHSQKEGHRFQLRKRGEGHRDSSMRGRGILWRQRYRRQVLLLPCTITMGVIYEQRNIERKVYGNESKEVPNI